jgi:tetratricopeptide (TPR) repeat protein
VTVIRMTAAIDTASDLDAGLAHHEAGRLAEAESLYRKILAYDPDDADALNLLGVILQDSGDVIQSLAVLSRAVAIDPTFSEALVNLARVQSAVGDPEAAKRSAQRAIDLHPDLAEAHLQLARTLLALADNAAAALAATRAVALTPASPDANLFLGHALNRLKDYPASETAYRAANRLAPDRHETVLNLGMVLSELKQHADAMRYCRRAVELKPNDPCAHAAIGLTLRRAEDIHGSVDALAEALKLAPDNAVVWRQQGDNLALLGRFDAAAHCYHRVLALDPASSEALSCLAMIGKLTNGDNERNRLQAVLADPDRPEMERLAAGFALGSLLDAAGDYDAAFPIYATANRLARNAASARQGGFDLNRFHGRIDQLKAAFVPAAFKATVGWGDPSEIPVFIVGMPRSGTTLVEQILASHPDVHGVGERKDVAAIERKLEAGTAGLVPAKWDPALVRREAETQRARLQALGGSSLRVVDKLPDNIMLLGHIAVLFPNARIIFCRRDLRDVCLSCFFQSFRDDLAWASDLEDCAARACEVERMSAHWRAVLPLRMLEVDYETLVGDQEAESRRLIEFLGLDWNDACLNFQATDRVVQTASLWQVRQPLYTKSVGRWRHYSRHIQPLLEGLVGLVPFEGTEMSPRQLLAGAGAHLLTGFTEAAEAAYRAVLEHEPDNLDALGGLGQVARARGDAPRAIDLLRRAIAGRPSDPVFLVELSRSYREAHDFLASAETAQAAAELNPDDPLAQFLLGSAWLDLDDATSARAALERAVKLAPHSRDALLYFAMACMRLKQYATAAAALEEAIRLRPHDVECLAKCGRLLAELGRHEEALLRVRQAVELAPEDGRALLALVTVLWLTNDVEGAATACAKALRLAPDLPELWLHDGYCKAALGQFADAGDSYRKALAINPDLAAAHAGLVTIGLGAEAQQNLERLRKILEDPHMDARERAAAGHALGDLLDRAGDYDAAWGNYAAANRLLHESHRTTGRPFDAVKFENHIEATIARFPSPLFLKSIAGVASDKPVFVVGMPRSGTSLVEQIASSHPSVFGAGELEDIRLIAARLDAGSGDPSSIPGDAAVAYEAETYLRRLRELGGDAMRVIDKMPDNFLWLGHIAKMFPHARVVICRRDYRDVGLSCYFQPFNDNLPWATDLISIAARTGAFDRLMSHWRAVLPLSILELQYEDLVQNFEHESRRLIEFLGLDWDPACLAFHRTERAVKTASVWQVRQPLFTSSVGRWCNYRRHLKPLLAGLAGLLPSEGDDDWDSLAADPPTALAIAVTHHRAGRLDYAEAIYRALLRRNPDEPSALHLLGLLRVDCGEAADAVALITRSLTLRPDVPLVLAGLACACCAAGDAEAAAKAARHALSLDPSVADAGLYLGRALMMRQETAGAVEVLRHAIEIAPGSVETWIALAAALTERRDHGSALAAWQAALGLRPADPALVLGCAGSLAELKRFQQALAAFQEVDAAAPGQPSVQYGIAVALMNTGDVAGAAAVCLRALETTQDSRFWLLLGNCEDTLGHFGAAAEAYRSARALDPQATGALHDLVALGGSSRDDDAARASAQVVLDDQSLPVRDRVAAGFTVGRICDRHGAYEDAFTAYALANRLLHDDRNARGAGFDRTKFRKLVDRQIATIDARTIAMTTAWGDASDLPVFVVGMPRSGTSLVEQIAASHKHVFGAGERMEMFGILGALDGRETDCVPIAWDRQAVRWEATAYVERLQELGGDAVRVIDKQPDNILCLGQIAVLFPNARVVVCHRDPRDVGLSCHFQHFRDDPLVWTNDLADCGFRARETERLMDHWRAVLPIPILEIQYESLVVNLENESRRLIDFLGLEWDPACLAFYQTKRVVMTASRWQVRQPVYSSSVGRWKHYRRHLGPLLQELHRDGIDGTDQRHRASTGAHTRGWCGNPGLGC